LWVFFLEKKVPSSYDFLLKNTSAVQLRSTLDLINALSVVVGEGVVKGRFSLSKMRKKIDKFLPTASRYYSLKDKINEHSK